ncbi:hypothetical protein [Mucilaginibacter sp.]
MKRCLILLIVVIWSYHSTAQNRSSIDSTWIKWNNDKVEKLNLTNLSTSKEQFHWRFGYFGQVVSYFVDLTTNENGSPQGIVTVYTEEYVDPTKEIPTHRVYDEKIILRPTQIDSLNQAIKTFKINTIPNQELIKGWGMGLDGVTYSVELRSNTNYSFKTYWTPEAQENVPEAKQMVEFIKFVELTTAIPRLEKIFTGHIPFESYNTGGPATAIRVLTSKQRKQYRKDRDAYRRQMHNTK